MSDIQKLITRLDEMTSMFMEVDKPEMASTCDYAVKTVKEHLKAIEAKDKEIENLNGQYKTLDIGFDKSLQINATQTKEIESLKVVIAELERAKNLLNITAEMIRLMEIPDGHLADFMKLRDALEANKK